MTISADKQNWQIYQDGSGWMMTRERHSTEGLKKLLRSADDSLPRTRVQRVYAAFVQRTKFAEYPPVTVHLIFRRIPA